MFVPSCGHLATVLSFEAMRKRCSKPQPCSFTKRNLITAHKLAASQSIRAQGKQTQNAGLRWVAFGRPKSRLDLFTEQVKGRKLILVASMYRSHSLYGQLKRKKY